MGGNLWFFDRPHRTPEMFYVVLKWSAKLCGYNTQRIFGFPQSLGSYFTRKASWLVRRVSNADAWYFHETRVLFFGGHGIPIVYCDVTSLNVCCRPITLRDARVYTCSTRRHTRLQNQTTVYTNMTAITELTDTIRYDTIRYIYVHSKADEMASLM